MPPPKPFKKRLVFTVTNDLNFDQRMIKICSSLQNNGYDVTLVGRRLRQSLPLSQQLYKQKRLSCFFEKGKLFYFEYNFRLFFYLLFQKMDLICAIDLDTILPCYWISVRKRIKRVYDAHELFCEMKEVVTRPSIYRFWKSIERYAVPKFSFGYTVCEPIKKIFQQEYNVNYSVIMNVSHLGEKMGVTKENFILYQGAVNHGRSFETLIPAFQWIDMPLWIYGDGNFYEECKMLIAKHNLQDKVFLKGKVLPSELKLITPKALLGVTLFENNGLSNYYSLGNRFFDYIQAGIPQLCVGYPAYKEINANYEVAELIEDLSPESIAKSINSLLFDKAKLERLHQNCLEARRIFNWQQEEKKLLLFYQNIFNN